MSRPEWVQIGVLKHRKSKNDHFIYSIRPRPAECKSPIYLQNYLGSESPLALQHTQTLTQKHTRLCSIWCRGNRAPQWVLCDFMPADGWSWTHRRTFCHSAGNNRASVSMAGLASAKHHLTWTWRRTRGRTLCFHPPLRVPLVMPRPLPVNPGNPSLSSEGRSASSGGGKSVLVAETASADRK